MPDPTQGPQRLSLLGRYDALPDWGQISLSAFAGLAVIVTGAVGLSQLTGTDDPAAPDPAVSIAGVAITVPGVTASSTTTIPSINPDAKLGTDQAEPVSTVATTINQLGLADAPPTTLSFVIGDEPADVADLTQPDLPQADVATTPDASVTTRAPGPAPAPTTTLPDTTEASDTTEATKTTRAPRTTVTTVAPRTTRAPRTTPAPTTVPATTAPEPDPTDAPAETAPATTVPATIAPATTAPTPTTAPVETTPPSTKAA